MASPYLGEIRALGFSFAPAGWAMCNGQLLSIAQADDQPEPISISRFGRQRRSIAWTMLPSPHE